MNNRKAQLKKIIRKNESRLITLVNDEEKLHRVFWQIAEADAALLKAVFEDIDNKK